MSSFFLKQPSKFAFNIENHRGAVGMHKELLILADSQAQALDLESPRPSGTIRSQCPTPPPTKSSLLRARHARVQHGLSRGAASREVPALPASPRYKAEDWLRLARPRAGYSPDVSTEVEAAVLQRNQFLRTEGYVDNPRRMLYLRFHGTLAEHGRNQSSMRAAVRAANVPSRERQRQILHNCWKLGRPAPDFSADD
jgi:hypothetical protein